MANPYIYHPKWLFVEEDYAGFEVAASVQRSAACMSLTDVDKSLIGRTSYWNEHVVPRLNQTKEPQWLRSEEIRRQLKITTCELAHMRDSGELAFKKEGNRYLYRHQS